MREFRRRLTLVVWLTLAGGLSQAPAQTPVTPPPQKADEQEPRLRIVTNEVRLPLRAFDPHGRPVADLNAEEVLVIEDGEACLVTGLRHEPADVLLVLDLGNTLGTFKSGLNEKVPDDRPFDGPNYSPVARPAAQDFANSLVRQLAAPDRIAILQYADRVELVQDWTRDRGEAISSLRAKFRAGLKARFYDALASAAARLQSSAGGRRVLVLITDGLDTASVSAKRPAFEQVMATGASVFVVSWAGIVAGEAQRSLKKRRLSTELLSPATFKRAGELKHYTERANRAAEDLKALAAGSGGEYWAPATFDELRQKPRALVGELGSEYTITYLSKKDTIDRAAGIPEIRVARPGMTVVTRQAAKVNSQAR